MSIFEKNKSKSSNYTIIIGCGHLGADIANVISDTGENVLIIDKDQDAFKRLSSSYGGLAVVGDGTSLSVLADADIRKATAVVAVTNDDNINIMVAQLAKEMFHVNHVIARLYDSERECVYNEFGIDTICPALLSAKEIDKILGIQFVEDNE